MAEIKDLSTTDASNNGTAANAGFPENMAYSDVNNAARALEGMIARWYADTNSTLDTGGSSNAYTLTPNRTVAAYARGDTYTVEASFTNTGAATINVSSLGAKSIVKPSGSAVASGDIQSGGIYTLVYDGTNFQMAGVDDPTTLSITTLTVSGVTTLNGNTVIGSDDSDTVTINADVASNVIPSADNTYDLGASGSEWKDLYIDGIAYVDTLNADSVDIDGGSIDGTTIGGSSAAAGTFTTISGTTITASTSLKTPLIEYTDGDDAITIADGGGVTIADLTATSIDVNGGTIDGAVIGGTTPAAGTFTTITGSGDLVIDTTTLVVDSTNNKVGIGIAAPTHDLHIHKASSSSQARIQMTTSESGATASDGYAIAMETAGRAYHWLYENANMVFATNNTLAVTIDSSQNVGIGTSSPSSFYTHAQNLVVGSGSGGEGLTIYSGSSDSGYIGFNDTASSGMQGFIQYNHDGDYMAFAPNGAEKMRIDSSGNVGIGATPSSNSGWNKYLSIKGGSSNAIVLDGTDSQEGAIGVVDGLYIDATGHTTATNNKIIFRTQSANSNVNGIERMRITSTGRVLIGTTSGNYTHDAGMRIVTSEVGSTYLDAALSLQGSGGDFYAQNWTGPSDTGFGLLTVFSGTTDYMLYAYRASSSNTNILQLYQNGDVQVHGAFSKGSGSFRITHPLPAKKDTHDLVHSFIEGPQADLIYRGAVDLVGGSATVNLDTAGRMTEGTFVLLNTNTQCFTSNESGWTPVKGSVSGNILTITAQDNTCTDTISWMVVGERQDQHMKDTDWTDADGKVIVEPEKEIEPEGA